MPVQRAKSGLMAKYGAKLDAAVKQHSEDETDYGFTRIPPGITNGVAQLVDAKFDVYKTGTNQGEYFFRAAGVVIEPESISTKNGEIKVAGLQTSIMIPVCDTKNRKGEVTTQAEYVEKILNEMRKLSDPAFTAGAGAAELESLAEALKEAKPYFRFSTSQSPPTPEFPDPRVWENWNGNKGLENYVPPDNAEVEDNTVAAPAAPPAPKAPAKPTPAPKTAPAKPQAPSKPTAASPTTRTAQPTPKPGAAKQPPAKPPVAPPTVSEPDEFGDLDSLATRADSPEGDDEAQETLTQFALNAGWTQEEIQAADNWQAVVEFLKAGGATEENPELETKKSGGTEWAPQVGEIYLYKPVDPRTKKQAPKAVECEVMDVDEASCTVTFKNLDNPKLKYSKISWDDFEVS